MSTVAVVLIVVAGVFLLFFAGGFLAARRRARRPEVEHNIRAADRALETARASDRGWERERMVAVATEAIRGSRAGYEWETLELVLVDDRPGVAEDRAHMVAAGPHGECLVVLARREGGEWFAHQVD